MASPLSEIEEKFLNCSICLDSFEEPKLLPCLHRYCKGCLDEIIQQHQRKFACPLCKKSCKIPPGGVDGFKTDFHIKSMVHFVQLDKNGVNHQTKDSTGHLADAPICSVCNHLPSENCCATCDNVPLCKICRYYGVHRQHDIRNLRTVAKEERKKLKQKLRVLDEFEDRVNSFPRRIEETRKELESNVIRMKENLRFQYEREARKIEREILDSSNALETHRRKVDQDELRLLSALVKEREAKLQTIKLTYDKLIKEARSTNDLERQTKQREYNVREERLLEKLFALGSSVETLDSMVSVEGTQKADEIDKLAVLSADSIGRYQNLRTTTKTLIDSGNSWADAQCLRDISSAVDPLIVEMENLPQFSSLSKITELSLDDTRLHPRSNNVTTRAHGSDAHGQTFSQLATNLKESNLAIDPLCGIPVAQSPITKSDLRSEETAWAVGGEARRGNCNFEEENGRTNAEMLCRLSSDKTLGNIDLPQVCHGQFIAASNQTQSRSLFDIFNKKTEFPDNGDLSLSPSDLSGIPHQILGANRKIKNPTADLSQTSLTKDPPDLSEISPSILGAVKGDTFPTPIYLGQESLFLDILKPPHRQQRVIKDLASELFTKLGRPQDRHPTDRPNSAALLSTQKKRDIPSWKAKTTADTPPNRPSQRECASAHSRLSANYDNIILTEEAPSIVHSMTILENHWTISDISCTEQGHVVLVGSNGENGSSHITEVDKEGVLIRNKILETDIFSTQTISLFCSHLSPSKIVTVSDPNILGIFDLNRGTYYEKTLSELTKNIWNSEWNVTCVAADTNTQRIAVGTNNSCDVYLFNNQLKYIKSVTLPDSDQRPIAMTFHEGNLILCDRGNGRAFLFSLKTLFDAEMLLELPRPRIVAATADTCGPYSVCTDRNGFIYMLWEMELPREQRKCVLVQYSRDGRQVVTTRTVDNSTVALSSLFTYGREYIVTATRESGELYKYELVRAFPATHI